MSREGRRSRRVAAVAITTIVMRFVTLLSRCDLYANTYELQACQKMAWEGINHKKDCKVLKNPNMKMLLNLKAATETLRFTD